MAAADISATISSVERILDYQFGDKVLAHRALTHGSSGRKSDDYQRLEFLGDRVLSLVVAELLYRLHSDENEGQMATRHSALVKGEACAAVGEKLGLHDHIFVGASEKLKGVQKTRSIVGDVVEALIGAIYLDGGLEAARAFINRHWAELIEMPDVTVKDAKTFVQEWALARAMPLPRYEVTSRTGPEHLPEFTVVLTVGRYGGSEGRGPSKRAAEMSAAGAFLAREGIR
jgi:ribonuclease III